MSIIAYYNGLMVGDRRTATLSSDNDYPAIFTSTPKVFKSPRGDMLIGVVGACITEDDLITVLPILTAMHIRYVDMDDDKVWTKEARSIILLGSRVFLLATADSVTLVNTERSYETCSIGDVRREEMPTNAPIFLGTGDAFAEYAFKSGKTLEHAVHIACELNPLCGDGVDVIKLNKKRSGGK
jgi:hypothetical protein